MVVIPLSCLIIFLMMQNVCDGSKFWWRFMMSVIVNNCCGGVHKFLVAQKFVMAHRFMLAHNVCNFCCGS